MIPLTTTVCQESKQKSSRWQTELAHAYRDTETLLTAINVSPNQVPEGISLNEHFPLRVPRGYVERMEPGNPHDPLLLQVLPRALEQAIQPGFRLDPVGEGPSTAVPGLLHKYQGRVLLITTGACPIHCRYCFRRHYPYSHSKPDNGDWSSVMNYITKDPSIREVILSGGDPLSLSNNRLHALTAQLEKIPHLRRLRIHTRMPVVLPERIDSGFIQWMTNLPWQTILVIHCNHPNEIDHQVSHSLAKIKSTGTTLLNQAVLLKGINDNAQALINLGEKLFQSDTLPYYLHLLDHVVGAAHFEVKESDALELMGAIQRKLPGYLVPKLVREVAGEPHKIQMSDCG